MPMTFGQFSEANRKRCESPQGFNHPLDGWSTSDWLTATVGELGEAANIIKARNLYGTRRRRSDGHKREGKCVIPGEIWRSALSLSYRHREVPGWNARSQQTA